MKARASLRPGWVLLELDDDVVRAVVQRFARVWADATDDVTQLLDVIAMPPSFMPDAGKHRDAAAHDLVAMLTEPGRPDRVTAHLTIAAARVLQVELAQMVGQSDDTSSA